MGLSDFFSSGGSKSTQSSNSGFLENDKKLASVTGYDGLANLFTSADDLYRNKAVPQFNMSSNIPGLFKEQEGAANAFANKMFANASAGGAMRGQFSPNSTPGIVGSAITNMGSTLLPMIAGNLQNAMVIPEQIRTQRFQNVLSPLQALIQGLGASAQGTSQTSGPGLGYQFGNAFMQSFGGGLGSSMASGASAGMGGGGLEGMASALKG